MSDMEDFSKKLNLLYVLVFAVCVSIIILNQLSLLNPSTFCFLSVFLMCSIFRVCKISPLNLRKPKKIEQDRP